MITVVPSPDLPVSPVLPVAPVPPVAPSLPVLPWGPEGPAGPAGPGTGTGTAAGGEAGTLMTSGLLSQALRARAPNRVKINTDLFI